jgi:hypothetical protein
MLPEGRQDDYGVTYGLEKLINDRLTCCQGADGETAGPYSNIARRYSLRVCTYFG